MPVIVDIMLIKNSTSGKKGSVSFDLEGFAIVRDEKNREVNEMFLEIFEGGIVFGGPMPGSCLQ